MPAPDTESESAPAIASSSSAQKQTAIDQTDASATLFYNDSWLSDMPRLTTGESSALATDDNEDRRPIIPTGSFDRAALIKLNSFPKDESAQLHAPMRLWEHSFVDASVAVAKRESAPIGKQKATSVSVRPSSPSIFYPPSRSATR